MPETDIESPHDLSPDHEHASPSRQHQEQKEEDVEMMEWQSPWPFVSATDEKLCELSAGAHWPWKPSMASQLKDPSYRVRKAVETANPSVDALLALAGTGSDVDLAVVARTAAEDNREDLWTWLEDHKASLHKCRAGSLATILSSLTTALGRPRTTQGDWINRNLLRHVAKEMLSRSISPRHALALLGSLKVEAEEGPEEMDELPVPIADLLTLASDTLHQRKDGDAQLLLVDIAVAMEGLAALRSTPLDTERSEQVSSLAKLLVRELRGGLGLSLLLVQSGQSKSGANQGLLLRLLAALAHLPEAMGPAAKWLPALGGVRWTREAMASQEATAAAAFALSRCGAWGSARASYLLSQALRRDRVEADRRAHIDGEATQAADEPRPYLVEDAQLISATAGSWWLAAIAQSGLDMESAADSEVFAEHASSALFAAVACLEGPEVSSSAKVRALWALHALGKASEQQELANSLLQQLAKLDASGFSAQSWWLLRELQPIMSSGSEDADGEGGETNPFSVWKDELSQNLEAEKATLTTQRGGELAKVVEELGGFENEEPEIGFLAEPYCLALFWRSRGKALDLDDRQSPVTRVLRRQQWVTLLPDVEVKQVNLADWDEDGGKNRLPLLRELLGADGDEPPE